MSANSLSVLIPSLLPAYKPDMLPKILALTCASPAHGLEARHQLEGYVTLGYKDIWLRNQQGESFPIVPLRL
jgi:hypothetical protein